MERRTLLAALLGSISAAASLAATPEATAMEATPVQWGPPRGPGWGPPPGYRGRRRPRCWIETRQIPFRDRWGRLRYRTVQREVCR